ncbi:MAG: DUF192 domain-containing protein [Candidatus Paceibacterota bacterium]
MEKILITSLVGIVLILTGVYVVMKNDRGAPFVSGEVNLKSIFLGEILLLVEVADSEEERRRGLSGRENLSHGRGMLFVFPEPGKHGIWMKDMLFSLDILWLDEEGKIVTIAENVTADSYPEVFQSGEDALYVLEMRAGFVDDLSIEVGHKFDLSTVEN